MVEVAVTFSTCNYSFKLFEGFYLWWWWWFFDDVNDFHDIVDNDLHDDDNNNFCDGNNDFYDDNNDFYDDDNDFYDDDNDFYDDDNDLYGDDNDVYLERRPNDGSAWGASLWEKTSLKALIPMLFP